MIIALQTLLYFRSSLLSALDRFLSPYYQRLTLSFTRTSPEDEEDDEEVFSEFDDEKGVVFYPPMYAQRYAAVSDCLMDERWCGKLEKVVDLGYHDMSFIKYLKELPGVHYILGVDIESIPLRCSSDLLDGDEYLPKREHPLQVTLFQGNAADPDYRLIGCDAVIAIEMIEHMLPHDLDRLVHTVFGFIKPWIVIFTTPNGDFNVLFKSLEKNGLRRLDHFFEWTREQFHDWCSNIVTRYPQFSVSCQGIGPGPPGTHHYGCCSQLALFVNKQYVKQQDWNLNSLALVSNVPSPKNVAELVGGWESPTTETENVLYPQETMDSLTEFLYSEKQSCVTILIRSPAYSIATLQYKDKMSQCNMDKEQARNFLMFNDEEMCFTIIVPRRKFDNRVYEIEDVTSRLNCTTFQVKKFSKTTQNLMAKNRVDSLVHTREVVSEIRHLTKMLNLNTKEALTEKGECANIWCNINWGDNAPYWNQYYKVVREYNYPFEVKSDETRIMDLITEEINRLIDAQFDDDEFSSSANRLEIPIGHLMRVVKHITNDVDKVKDLLEWNGYEVVGNIVIHSRMIVDNVSSASCDDEWQENDTLSEFESTDIHSTTISDGSTIAPDYHGRCLRRALDKKVRALRAMLSADEDITTELDHVVCRLMKLALRKGKQAAPPTRWMQCKLLDLLTLTEKAISRRKRHYIEKFSFKAIEYGYSQFDDLNKLKVESHDASRIMNKYNHILKKDFQPYDPLDFGYEDELVDATKEINLDDMRFTSNTELLEGLQRRYSPEKLPTSPILISQDPFEEIDQTTKTMSSSDHNSISTGESNSYKKAYKRNKKPKDGDNKARKRSYSKIMEELTKPEEYFNIKKSKTNLKKLFRNKSTSSTRIYGKKIFHDFGTFGVKPKRLLKEYKKLQPTASKPIPGSLIELCHPELMQANTKEFNYKLDRNPIKPRTYDNVAAPKDSVLIGIVMDDTEETVALRRSIGTEPDMDVAAVEQELGSDIGNVAHVDKSDSLHNKLLADADTVQSQTMFLFDINEPSTSKGVRHVSMDVQCGTDAVLPPFGLLTPPASVTRMPKIFSNGIKINDSLTNITSTNNSVDLESSKTNNIENFGPVCSRIRTKNIFSKGIKIEDSLDSIKKGSDLGISTKKEKRRGRSPTTRATRTKIKDSLLVKPKSQDSGTTAYEKCGRLSPKRIYSRTMPDVISEECNENETHKAEIPRLHSPFKRTFGVKIQNSISDLQSRDSEFPPCDNFEEYITLSPRSKSPVIFNEIKDGESYTSVLDNFHASIIDSVRSRNASPRRWSPIVRARVETTKDSSTDVKTSGLGTSLGSPKETKMASSTADIRLTPNSDRPEPCKILSPSRVSSPIKFKLRTSLISVKMSQTSDVGTSITDDCEKNSTTNKVNTTDENILDGPNFVALPETKIDESVKIQAAQVSAMTSADVCESNNNLTLRTRCFGFKVKDVDENLIKKVEFSTTRVELLSDGSPSTKLSSTTKTETLKPVSSAMKTENSSSEFCSYYCVSPKSSADFTSDIGVRQSPGAVQVKETQSPTRLNRQKLSCGGVHVHSYKEKQSSEDIVYQGEWQRQIPRPLKQIQTKQVKKTPDINAKKTMYKKIVFKEQKLTSKPTKKWEVKKDIKPLSARNMQLTKATQETTTDKTKKNANSSLARAGKGNCKTVKKVASKIGVSSISSKNVRCPYVTKKNPNITQSPLKRDCDIKTGAMKDNKSELGRKSYLPAYLKKRKTALGHFTLNQSIDTVKNCIKVNKDNKNKNSTFPRMDKEKIKSDLLKVQDDAIDSISYIVFRNELENNKNANSGHSADNSNRTDGANRAMNICKRSSSPISMTSSACSSPDSVATTIKVMSTWSKMRHSTSSNKSPVTTTDTEAPPSTNKNKKLVKRCKINKKDHSNKENIPETSKPAGPEKEDLQNVKSAFYGRNKNVFMAFANDSGAENVPLKHTLTKSNIKIPAIENTEEKKPKSKPAAPNSTNRKSLQSSSQNEDIKNQESLYSEISNMITLIEDRSKVKETISQPMASEDQVSVNRVDSSLLSEWLESVSVVEKESTESAILLAMRQIIEGRLDFINFTESKNSSFEDCYDIDDTSSLKSYKTVVPSDDGNLNSTLKSEIENAMNRSFEAITGGTSATSLGDDTDMDLLSFKSVTSVSKYSEYFLADNKQMSTADDSVPKSHNVVSVQDIFERKDLSVIPNPPPGPLAIQAFSGYSMNVDPIVGDQPDYVNLIDSETGSMALDFGRLATSEELFVSGRSSESYATCLIDEDAVVPNWLFQIISQQHSIHEEEDLQELVPLQMPVVEPAFDVNGNVVEPNVGLGAGAGDGRGMHSDHSQDSSGRGSSLSTTDTSSGQQSEAILIDPSAFTTQFELHEPIGSSTAVTTLVRPLESPEANRHGGNELQALVPTRNDTLRIPINPLFVSDGEADVSSLDTDVPDSSDN